MSMISSVAQLVHFSHRHPLNIVHLQPNQNNDEEDEEEEEENKDIVDFVAEEHHFGQCNMCKEDINSFHLCYYKCKDCNYCLHRFCAELPTTLQDHPLHSNHNLTLSEKFQFSHPNYTPDTEWTCGVCHGKKKNFFNYHCSICKFSMDIICATISQIKMDHPSHPHQLQRNCKKLLCSCNACGHEHEGTFYQCTTCHWFWIQQDCALSPTKLLIQQPTDGTFTHSHPLTLAYSFPYIDQEAKFYPRCRICNEGFRIYFWNYKCDKCRYYVHIDCAISKYVNFLHRGPGKMRKNFEDTYHPVVYPCPLPDETYKHLLGSFLVEENKGKMLKRFLHEHPLILIDTQTSLINTSVLLHDPMNRIQLLCDVCVKPITNIPFYKCSQDFRVCGFVLHEWCAWLPYENEGHPREPYHTLFLMRNVTTKFFGVFWCRVCVLPSNGFGYRCGECDYYTDISCAFLPRYITHEAHPSHLFTISDNIRYWYNNYKTCIACRDYVRVDSYAYYCGPCDLFLHTECALWLPRKFRNKHDKHPLSLRYEPVENHPGDYFCGICEEEIDPINSWFYHCEICVESMHTSCAPVILQCEQAVYAKYKGSIFKYINVKFGGALEIACHPHRLTFVQGIACHGKCKECDGELQYEMIFKCSECEYALDYKCAEKMM